MNESRLPDWVDQQLSEELPVLRARGEGQSLEYKSCFPSNAHELAKEVAAFATSNPGVILLGVGNQGELVGLEVDESAPESPLPEEVPPFSQDRRGRHLGTPEKGGARLESLALAGVGAGRI